MPYKDRRKQLAYFKDYNKNRRDKIRQRECILRYNRTHPEILTKARESWEKRHPERAREIVRRCNLKRRTWILNYFGNKCVVCGETNPIVLEVHHIAGKADSIFKKTVNNMSREQIRIEAEAHNLELLCANCHLRKRTSQHFNL